MMLLHLHINLNADDDDDSISKLIIDQHNLSCIMRKSDFGISKKKGVYQLLAAQLISGFVFAT